MCIVSEFLDNINKIQSIVTTPKRPNEYVKSCEMGIFRGALLNLNYAYYQTTVGGFSYEILRSTRKFYTILLYLPGFSIHGTNVQRGNFQKFKNFYKLFKRLPRYLFRCKCKIFLYP
jgi:hypothetical protein